MREIKYRAWDRDRKVMANVSCIDFLTGQVQMNAGGMHSERVSGDKVILLQYTDLKDKNGVEIYDGDIVVDINLEHNQETKGIVVFDRGGFHVVLQIKEFKFKLPFNSFEENESSLQVLGNI